MPGLTQVSSLGCNLHLFYPSFVASAGPEPGKQIAMVSGLHSVFSSVVEHGNSMRESGWGCGIERLLGAFLGRNAVVLFHRPVVHHHCRAFAMPLSSHTS